MDERCELRSAMDIYAECEEDTCIFWRAVDHLGVESPRSGCAIQYFELLGEEGSEIASWLLSVRDRLMLAEEKRDDS